MLERMNYRCDHVPRLPARKEPELGGSASSAEIRPVVESSITPRARREMWPVRKWMTGLNVIASGFSEG